MTPERDLEQVREILMHHEGRLAALEAHRDNERARHASTPAWLFGVISAAVALGSLLLNLLVQFRGTP